jgi:hypothetical protein
VTESLELKWGTIKGWSLKQLKTRAIMQDYYNRGVSISAMNQRDTPEQKTLICDLIDALDGTIVEDWSGETLSKNDAKKYIMEYRK